MLPVLPPEPEGEAGAGAAVVELPETTGEGLATGACGVGEDAAEEPPPAEPEAAPDDDPPQFPVKPVPDLAEVPVTSGPGSGKTTSCPSTVVQPFPIFALKMSGREEKATVLALLVPPPMVIDAQFM